MTPYDAERHAAADDLARSLVRLSTARKQEIGGHLAATLGVEAGPPGPDGGVDGALRTVDGRLAHVSVKLTRGPLDVNHAKITYADVLWHRAAVSVMVSGGGYKSTFERWWAKAPHLDSVPVHHLTLFDVLARTAAFEAARAALPLLDDLAAIDWAAFRA